MSMEKHVTTSLVSDRIVVNSGEEFRSSQQSGSSVYHNAVDDLLGGADFTSAPVDSGIPEHMDDSISVKCLQRNDIPMEFSDTGAFSSCSQGVSGVSESPNVSQSTPELGDLFNTCSVNLIDTNKSDAVSASNVVTCMYNSRECQPSISTAKPGSDVNAWMNDDSDLLSDIYNSLLLVEANSDAENVGLQLLQENKGAVQFHDNSVTSKTCSGQCSNRSLKTSASANPSNCHLKMPEVTASPLDTAESDICLETVMPVNDDADINALGSSNPVVNTGDGEHSSELGENNGEVSKQQSERVSAPENVSSVANDDVDKHASVGANLLTSVGEHNCELAENGDHMLEPPCEETSAPETVTSLQNDDLDKNACAESNLVEITGINSGELSESCDQLLEPPCEEISAADSDMPVASVVNDGAEDDAFEDSTGNLTTSTGEHNVEVSENSNQALELDCEEITSECIEPVTPVEDDVSESPVEFSNLVASIIDHNFDLSENGRQVSEPLRKEVPARCVNVEPVILIEDDDDESVIAVSHPVGSTREHNSDLREDSDQVSEPHMEPRSEDVSSVELVKPVEDEVSDRVVDDTDLATNAEDQNCELRETSDQALELSCEDIPTAETVVLVTPVEGDVDKEATDIAVSTGENCERRDSIEQALQLHGKDMCTSRSEQNSFETERNTVASSQPNVETSLPVVCSEVEPAASNSCTKDVGVLSVSTVTSGSEAETSTVVTITALHSATSTSSDMDVAESEPCPATDGQSSVIIVKRSSTLPQSSLPSNVSSAPILPTLLSDFTVDGPFSSAATVCADQTPSDSMPSISLETSSAANPSYRPAGEVILNVGKNLATEYVFKEIVDNEEKWKGTYSAEKEKIERIKAAYERVAAKNEIYHHKVGHRCHCGFFAQTLRSLELHKYSGSVKNDNSRFICCCYCKDDHPYITSQFIQHMVLEHGVPARLRLPATNQCPYCSFSSRRLQMCSHIKFCRARFLPHLNQLIPPGMYDIPLMRPVPKPKSTPRPRTAARLPLSQTVRQPNSNAFHGSRVAVHTGIVNSTFTLSAVKPAAALGSLAAIKPATSLGSLTAVKPVASLSPLAAVKPAASLGPVPVSLFTGVQRPISVTSLTSFPARNAAPSSTVPTFVSAQMPLVNNTAAIRIPAMNYVPVVPVGIITNRYTPLSSVANLASSSHTVLVQRPAVCSSSSTGNILQNVGSIMPLNRPLGQLLSLHNYRPTAVQKPSIYSTSSASETMLNLIRASTVRPGVRAQQGPVIVPVQLLSKGAPSASSGKPSKKLAGDSRCRRFPVVVLKRLNVTACEVCGTIFKDTVLLLSHMQKAHGIEVKEISEGMPRKPLQCFCCQQRFYSKQGVMRHMRIFHEVASNMYTCQRCSETGIVDLVEHYRVKHNMPLHTILEWRVCCFCRLNFATASEVEKHVVSEHKDLFHTVEEFRQAVHKSLQNAKAAAVKKTPAVSGSSSEVRVVDTVAQQPVTNRKRRHSESEVIIGDSSDLRAAAPVKRRKCDNETGDGERKQPPVSETLVAPAKTSTEVSTEVQSSKEGPIARTLRNNERNSVHTSNSPSHVVKAGLVKANGTKECHTTAASGKGSVRDGDAVTKSLITKECVISLSHTADIVQSSQKSDIQPSTPPVIVTAQVKPLDPVVVSLSQITEIASRSRKSDIKPSTSQVKPLDPVVSLSQTIEIPPKSRKSDVRPAAVPMATAQVKPSDPAVDESSSLSGRFSCSLCSKNLGCWISFRQHFRSLHGIDMQQCPQCREPLPRGVLLVQHITQKHLRRCSVDLRRISAKTGKNVVPLKRTKPPTTTVSSVASTCSVSLSRMDLHR